MENVQAGSSILKVPENLKDKCILESDKNNLKLFKFCIIA
jgi:hypothetical protein